jgi:class 3 adenylate cyclase
MNVTSRIEDIAAGGEILVSDSTLQQLTGSYRVGSSREVNMKGIGEAIMVHQILGSA